MNQNFENQSHHPWIPFSQPELGPEEEAAALRVLRSGWLTTGKEAGAFEAEFSEHIHQMNGQLPTRALEQISEASEKLHCIGVNSATAGMHLALDALNVRPGDLVIVPSYTFVSTAEVVRYLGAIPYFVDCQPDTFHLDVDIIKKILQNPLKRRKIRGIITVHISGCSWRLKELADLCTRYGIFLIEDSAHAFPSACAAGVHGTLGTVGVFSFYANKTITTGEGGMVVTTNPQLAKNMEIKRLHGIDRNVWQRYTNPQAGPGYDVTVLGYKYNLPDILAAIGREQLRKAQKLQSQRESLADTYTQYFQNREWLITPFLGDSISYEPDQQSKETPNKQISSHSWHLYILRIRLEKLTIGRDEFTQELKRRGIGTSLHFIPVHRFQYYQKKTHRYPKHIGLKLDQTNKISDSAISLPLFPTMSSDQIQRIIAEVLEIGDTHFKNHG